MLLEEKKNDLALTTWDNINEIWADILLIWEIMIYCIIRIHKNTAHIVSSYGLHRIVMASNGLTKKKSLNTAHNII